MSSIIFGLDQRFFWHPEDTLHASGMLLQLPLQHSPILQRRPPASRGIY